MEFKKTSLNDVLLIIPKVFGDERGFFMETWNEREFTAVGVATQFVQDNHSRSRQGILRGMHYQTEHTQGKLVRVLSGAVYDAVVDMRRSSSTFGRWYGAELSADNKHMLWVPPGFAHGFYVLSPEAEFFYKCTDFYHPQSEVSMRWDDPEVGIEWPLVDGKPPQLSAKDAEGLGFVAAPKFP
jgi:dTDP-4-dehydrorhamnose 3,5-epimerase